MVILFYSQILLSMILIIIYKLIVPRKTTYFYFGVEIAMLLMSTILSVILMKMDDINMNEIFFKLMLILLILFIYFVLYSIIHLIHDAITKTKVKKYFNPLSDLIAIIIINIINMAIQMIKINNEIIREMKVYKLENADFDPEDSSETETASSNES